jgi:hypothetical protein
MLEREEVEFLKPRHSAATPVEKNSDYRLLISLLPFLGDITPSRKISVCN